MKWSRYNIFFKASTGDFYLLYNTMSNFFARIDIANATLLNKLQDGELLANELDPDTLRDLTEKKVLVENDDVEMAKFKLIKQYNRMNNKTLSLTIAPTLACNLHCSYCFEKKHPNIYMDDKVEDDIINFIAGHKDIEKLHISWFGGEPLLNFPRIVSLTRKMLAIPNIKDYSAEIITNGVCMDSNKADVLGDLRIKTVHVTIDGIGNVHNQRRKGCKGEDTYSKIINALDILSQYDDISKTIRVNIDKSNCEEFVKVFTMINKRYHGLNFNTYLGFIKDSYGCGNACTGCFATEEQGLLVMEAYKQLSQSSGTLTPQRYNYECIARQKNGFLIGPKGEIYKCWTDLGNSDMCLGNINNLSDISQDLLAQYMVGADPFSDVTCQSCFLLPFCGGGCPHSRIMNDFYGSSNNNCHFAKWHIKEFLETSYYLQNKLKFYGRN